jgi:glycosyltransferase involved in cell wall biosynthesis
MTHYPKHSQTFLLDEVVAVHGRELEIVPVALNPPDTGDVESDIERRESTRTFYVKSQSPLRVAKVVWQTFRRDPGGVTSVLLRTVASARAHLRDAIWRVFAFVEAAVVWENCEANGCRHVHAQFGTAPATVAMIAAELGNQLTSGKEPVTWSYTIHGYHEFTAEDRNDLARKTSSAAFVVAISDYTRSQLMRLSPPRDWEKLHRVHCGVDLERFAYEPRDNPHDPPTVVTVGRLSPEKGQFAMLDAALVLKSRGVQVRMKIIGDGPSRAELHERARVLDVDDVVEFTGPVAPEVVAEELGNADVFCLASFAEGIPVSVMEALARGVPVVATYVGGVPELIETGVSGWAVPAGRADLVADAIEALVGDAELRARVQKEGRRRVETEHDLRRTSAEMRSLLLLHA